MTTDPVLDALIDLCRAVSEHPDSMSDGAPLNGPFTKAMEVVRAHVAPAGELTNVTRHSIQLGDYDDAAPQGSPSVAPADSEFGSAAGPAGAAPSTAAGSEPSGEKK